LAILLLPFLYFYMWCLYDDWLRQFAIFLLFPGTGASCVYPLLGAKKNGWSFIATESDGTNYQYAKKNVENNQMTDKIKGSHNISDTKPMVLYNN